MQLPTQGPNLPNYANPPAPPQPLQTMSHQAAGVELGCPSCTQQNLGEIKAVPTWAKVLAGLSALGLIIAITTAVARR